MAIDPAAASAKAIPALGEFNFVTKAIAIEPPDDGGKRRFKMIASSTIIDEGKDEIKMSALEDLRAAYAAGRNVFTDHEHKVDNVFGRTDGAVIKDSGERDPKTGAPIFDLHIAGVVNEPDPRMVRLADSIDGGYVTFGASIGARVLEHKRNKAGGLDIYHLDGKEVSLVGIPMNQRSWTYKAAKAARALDAAEPEEDEDEETEKALDTTGGEPLVRQDLEGPKREKGDMSAAQRNRLSDSDFACPEKRKYPINDAAHVRAALSRIADPSNDQCGRSRIIAAARKMGIGQHGSKSYSSNATVGMTNGTADTAVNFVTTDAAFDTLKELNDREAELALLAEAATWTVTTDPDGFDIVEEPEAAKSADNIPADEPEPNPETKSADGQESAEADAPAETPETASEASDAETSPADEQKALAFEAADVVELAMKARDLAALVNERDEEIESLKAENARLAAENEEAKTVIEKVMALPLRRKAIAPVHDLSARFPDYLAPEVREYLTKTAGENA